MAPARQAATDVARAVLELAPSGLFDAAWYLKQYGEIATPRGDLLVHFCNSGWPDHLWPSFHFQTDWYLANNPDVVELSIDPLLHYWRFGERENRRPSPHFDVAWYRAHHGLGAADCCLAHFLARRRTAPTSPDERFDAAWYAGHYPEIASEDWDPVEHFHRVGSKRNYSRSRDEHLVTVSGLFDGNHYRRICQLEIDDERDLVHHFCRTGWRQHRNPNPVFDTAQYLARNDDVREAGINPLIHYIEHGERENRFVSDAFDAAQHRELQGLDASVSALGHFLETTGRRTRLARHLEQNGPATTWIGAEISAVIMSSGLFDESHYLISYPDVRQSSLAPLDHFCGYGAAEGRRPNAYFDSAWYRSVYMSDEEHTANPLLHYILRGEPARHRPIVYFDTAWYAKHYRIAGSISPLLHYLRNRRRQCVSPNPLFDVAAYARAHGRSVGPNRDLFAHYLRAGIAADLDPGPDFDAKDYRGRRMQPGLTPFKATPGAEVHERIRRERLNPLVHHLMAAFSATQAPHA